MRNICIVLVLIFSVHSAYSQIVGLRVNTEFSENVKINLAPGVGGYLILDEFSKPFEAMLSFDFSRKNKKFLDEEIQSRYKRYSLSISGLYIFSVSENVKIKAGPGISYGNIDAAYGGLGANWIKSHASKAVGAQLITNLHFKEVLGLPINLDLFFTPAYYHNLKIVNDPNGVDPFYGVNYALINLKFGISYKIKE